MQTIRKNNIRRVCVFCGSQFGNDAAYRQAAIDLGREIVSRGYGLVYGGGSVGLMGTVADAVLAAGGEVIGVIPEMLAVKELLHANLTTLHTVPGMHARKALMAEQSDAFIALPGGYGTFEELLEIVTWAQLGIHKKPIGLLDVRGYYAKLIEFFDHAIAEGFIKPQQRHLLVTASDPRSLLDLLEQHEMPTVKKWITPDET